MAHTILAVDDSELMQETVKITLESAGYRVLVANRGEKALAHFMSGGISAVVTDINMPGMDGISLIQEIRKHDEEVPIVVLTSESRNHLLDSAQAAGANTLVAKPYYQEPFVNLIRELLSPQTR